MKKFLIFIIIVSAIGIAFAFIANNVFVDVRIKNLESTDLSNILIEDFTIGSDMSTLEVLNYRRDYVVDRTYNDHFEGMSLAYNNNIITKIRGVFEIPAIEIKIRNRVDYKNISEIKEEFGSLFVDAWHNKGLGQRKTVYRDNELNILAIFIYSSTDDSLTEVILDTID